VTVYHGSNTQFDAIDVAKGKPYKDFGRGFYVSRSFSHAENLARRNMRLLQARYGRAAHAYVYTYEMDSARMTDFKVKEFSDADAEWMTFVLANRKVPHLAHDYDIVLGPTANDDTSTVLSAYFGGFYGEVGSDRAIAIALEMIEADKLPAQIYFSTNEATSILSQKGAAKRV
jgi:hypothetical protein